MNIIYALSVICLLLSFLLIEKNNQKLSIIKSIIYTICLFFCYQTVIVCLLSYLKLGGHILNYSIANLLIILILFLRIIKNKKTQKYYFDKLDFVLVTLALIITFLIVSIRFNNFSNINYASDDSAIHYKAAKLFSQNLEILNSTNSKDIIHGNFDKMMPISYINGGYFIYMLSNIPSYRAFLFYDGICLILESLLFSITICKITKKNNILYQLTITVLYITSYPLNSLIYGFCYLGLSTMIINLLLVTIKDYEKNINKNIYFKSTIILMMTYSIFYSYYLFVPFIYLSLGLYYIKLCKQKKITMKTIIIYGLITLILPFILGFTKFILPIVSSTNSSIGKVVKLEGATYENITPIIVFMILTIYFIYHQIKKKEKINYLKINIYCLSINIVFFLILRELNLFGTYYLYKLFYPYFLLIFIDIAEKMYKHKKAIYIISGVILYTSLMIMISPNNIVSNKLEKINIYNYNAKKLVNSVIYLNKDELELIEKTKIYKKECEQNNEFILIGSSYKNLWFYEITESIPVLNHSPYNRDQFNYPNVKLYMWKKRPDIKCALVLKEMLNESDEIDKSTILFENNKGYILKKHD